MSSIQNIIPSSEIMFENEGVIMSTFRLPDMLQKDACYYILCISLRFKTHHHNNISLSQKNLKCVTKVIQYLIGYKFIKQLP
jgi:hypothetical protein